MSRSLVKISEATALALHATIYLASQAGRRVPLAVIAKVHGASAATLSKVMQRLVHAGLVRSVRGPRGGFELLKDPGEIALVAVYEAIEGPLSPAHCLLQKRVCDGSQCILGPLVEQVNREVRDYLENTNIAQLVGVYKEIRANA